MIIKPTLHHFKDGELVVDFVNGQMFKYIHSRDNKIGNNLRVAREEEQRLFNSSGKEVFNSDDLKTPPQEPLLATPMVLENPTTKNEGLRFNDGKTRHDLIPAFAQEQYAKVLTAGSNKYADRNWEKGMPWGTVLASLKRHINAFERGEDFDPETGIYHMAHVMCNAAFLVEYYKLYPQGDNRPHGYLTKPKIGLDVDEVLADFIGTWTKKFGQTVPEVWNFDKDIKEKFDRVKDDKDFWMGIKPKIDPSDLPFEPHCYITSRIIPKEWTEEWIQNNGFPTMPVYSIGHDQSKVEVAKQSGIDIFVDDRYENFVELNQNGICCYLMDAPHNRRYEVGYKRVKSLKDLILK